MNELISIIVPVYKVEKYLDRCIDSVLAQTYANIEVILVDDGSTDRCGKMCDEYAKNDNRVKVIHKTNGGLSDARNAGLDIATGDYIGFVDSDDYIAKNMFEKLYQAILETKADMSMCGVEQIDEKNTKLITESLPDDVTTGIDVMNYKINSVKGWLYIVSWNKLYSNNLFQELRFCNGKLHEDEFIANKILFRCNKIACISDRLYFYFRRSDSITLRKVTPRRMDAVEALIERAEILISNQCLSSAVYDTLIYGAHKLGEIYIKCDKTPETKIRYSELQKKYREVYKQCDTKCFSIKERCQLCSYFISSKNTYAIREFFKL